MEWFKNEEEKVRAENLIIENGKDDFLEEDISFNEKVKSFFNAVEVSDKENVLVIGSKIGEYLTKQESLIKKERKSMLKEIGVLSYKVAEGADVQKQIDILKQRVFDQESRIEKLKAIGLDVKEKTQTLFS